MSIFGRRRPAKGILTVAAEGVTPEVVKVVPYQTSEFAEAIIFVDYIPNLKCPACGVEKMHEWAGYAYRCAECGQEVLKEDATTTEDE